MRRIVIGVFARADRADMTCRRLEMRGFEVECVDGPPTEAGRSLDGVARSAAVREAPWRGNGRLFAIVRATMWYISRSQMPRRGEVHVKVRANTLLEAQAARDILDACGARAAGSWGEAWSNWNW